MSIDAPNWSSRTWQVTTDLLGVANAEGVFFQVNPAWETVLGWSEAETAQILFFDLIHPDDLPKTQAAFRRLIGGEPVLRFENRYRTKGGDYRDLSWVAVPEDGLFFCSARDVTEERAQARELAKRTQERDRLWNNSQDIQIIIDGTGVFEAVNPAFTAILGWTSENVIGRTAFEFILPEDERISTAALVHLREAVLPVTENRYRHRDGGFR